MASQDDLDLAIERFKNRSFMADIAGDLGASRLAPTLTNLSNALIVSAHGKAGEGFYPDKSATNKLAKTIQQRIDSGGNPLTMEEISKSMGSATNDVKRVIIDACFAAGYNFNTVKKLFPNLEQLVAPSTDKPTSAGYIPYLTREKQSFAPYQTPELAPFFNITPRSTNLVTQASDWTKQPGIAVPIPPKEAARIKEFGNIPPAVTNYSGKATVPAGAFLDRLNAARAWQLEQYKKAESEGRQLTDKDYEDILEQARKMIREASKAE